MPENRFVGAWKLVGYDPGPTGASTAPREGQIMYSADGYMSVAIMTPNRAPLPDGAFRDASPEQVAATLTNYVSYCGRYTVLPDRVIHHVTVSLTPNRVGEDLTRFYELEGNRVTLRTPEGARLTWERLPPATT